jgi:hypothetical protein
MTSDEILSPSLRKVLERHGVNDDHVTSLLIVERYQRRPNLSNSVVTLMLEAIDKQLPLEAAIVRREVKLGRGLTEQEMEQAVIEFWPAA